MPIAAINRTEFALKSLLVYTRDFKTQLECDKNFREMYVLSVYHLRNPLRYLTLKLFISARFIFEPIVMNSSSTTYISFELNNA